MSEIKECHCKDRTSIESEDDEDSDNEENYEQIQCDFETTNVLTERKKPILFYNNQNKVYFKIKRHNPSSIYEHFKFERYKGTRKPSEKLKLIFKPLFPFQHYLDSFTYTDSNNRRLKITVKGESTGPACQISTKKLEFIKMADKVKTKYVVELINNSNVTAEFKFDLNNSDVFKIEPKDGEVPPNKYIYVTIYFQPNCTGSFTKHVTCLVLNSLNPVQMLLFGNCSKEKFDIDENSLAVPSSFKEYQGYLGYLRDELVPTYFSKSPYSLSEFNIYFDRILNGGSNSINVCFTNEMLNEIRIKWQKNNPPFNVHPLEIGLMPESPLNFEVSFTPNESNTFYCDSLLGELSWVSKKSTSQLNLTADASTIQRLISVKLLGHSFPQDEYWPAYVEMIPEIITLPPSLPGDYTAGTFKLVSKGILPVMFRLIPPKKRIVTMKPMMGILKPFSIIVVAMHTQAQKIYIEEWKMELNGLETKQISFYIRSECCVPAIEIGKDNQVSFDSVQPQSTISKTIPLKNLSSLGVKYKFAVDETYSIQFNPNSGQILPNETIFIRCQYTGNPCMPPEAEVKCEMQAFHRVGEYFGKIFETFVKVYTSCSQSFLCSTPNNIDFGPQTWNSELECQFWVFNFGISPIYFILHDEESTEETKPEENDFAENFTGKIIHDVEKKFQIHPHYGEVKPGEKLKINVKGFASKAGKNVINITYRNRVNKEKLGSVQGESRKLLEIEYEALYPTIQILEITEHNFGALFGKLHFWEYLQIDQINNILQTIEHDTTKEVHLLFPDCEVGNDTFYLNLLLQNVSQFETEVHLKRKKVCDCSIKEAEGHVNIRKKVHDCPHREMLSMEMLDAKFYPNSYHILTINVQYTLPCETKMAYVLQLSNNRNIELNFTMHGIPNDILILSSYKGFDFKLKNIFIGRYEAPVQCFWLYNNTSRETTYFLDDEDIERMCKIEGFQVLTCLNREGEIGPYSLTPILIKFHPIEAKTYKIVVPLIIGDEKVTFPIQGEGVHSEEQLNIKMPVTSSTPHVFPIILSHDYFNIEAISIWGCTQKIVFIKNVTKDKLIQYEWKVFEIPEIIKVTFENERGILKPKEVHSQIITFETLAEPCSMQFLIACEILDYTQITLHKMSKELSAKRQQEVIEEFTITDKGTTVHPQNKVKIYPEPKLMSTTIFVNINSYHRRDIDMFLPIEKQFEQSPLPSLEKTDTKQTEKNAFEGEQTQTFRNVLDKMLGEFICSEKFKTILQISNAQPPPYYNQFLLEDLLMERKKRSVTNEERDRYRKKEVEKFFKQSPAQNLADAMKNIVVDSLHDSFKVGRITNDVDINREVEKLLQICTDEVCMCKNK